MHVPTPIDHHEAFGLQPLPWHGLTVSATLLTAGLVGVAYAAGAALGHALQFAAPSSEAIWPPNALLLAALCLTPLRRWWIYLLAVVPAHVAVQLLSHVPLWRILWQIGCNSALAVLGAYGIAALTGRPLRLDTMRQVAVFLAVACCAVPALVLVFSPAAVLAALPAPGGVGLPGGAEPWLAWRRVYLSNVVALLTLTPLVVLSITHARSLRSVRPSWRVLEACLLASGLVLVSALVFGMHDPGGGAIPALVYAPLPFLLWAALRFGPTGIAAGLTVVAVLSIWNAVHGRGPFTPSASAATHVLNLQAFVIALSVPLLLLTALIEERRHAALERDRLNMQLERAVEARTAQLAREIEQHAQAAEQARQTRDELQVLLAIANDLVSMHNLNAMLARILDHLAAVVDYHSAYISTLSDTTVTIRAFRTQLDVPDIQGRTVQLRSVPALERVVTTQQPLLVADLQQDGALLRSSETPIGTPSSLRALVAVPLIVDGRTIGVLSLEHQVAGYYRPADLERVQSFAAQITIAIQNIRLSERDQQVAVLEERHRLARELHDAVTQTVFSASLIAEALPMSWREAPPLALRGIAQLHQMTRAALAELRSLLFELRPAALTEKPLGTLLGELCRATGGRSGIPIELDVQGGCTKLQSEVQIGLYRLAQEALNNIVKHADASEVRVMLACRPAEVVLMIRDNGRGFDPQLMPPDTFGLPGMRERAAHIGATLRIESARHKGTHIVVEWRPGADGAPKRVDPPDAAVPTGAANMVGGTMEKPG